MDIPQIEEAGRYMKGGASCDRACAKKFAVKEDAGMLWVWLGKHTDVAAELSTPAGVHVANSGRFGDWMMRDLPISWDFLMENLLDPSHVHFAHHGVIGNRNRGRGPLRVVPVSDAAETSRSGFSLRINGLRTNQLGTESDDAGYATTHFQPPALAWLQFALPGGSSASMLFYAVPVSPGHSRIITGYASDAVPSYVRYILQLLTHSFQWAIDLGSHQVLDGDTLILRAQEDRFNELQVKSWRNAYFMPAGADAGVAVFRHWLDHEGGGAPDYAQRGNAVSRDFKRDRREILNRYEQHTRYCPYCSRALRLVQLARTATAASGALSLATAVIPGALSPVAVRPWAALGAAAGFYAVNIALGRLERQFIFTDYNHTQRNS